MSLNTPPFDNRAPTDKEVASFVSSIVSTIIAAGAVALSGGTNIQSTGTVVFSNSNGVSFGLDTNGVMTATVTPGAAAGIAALAGGTQTATSGTLVFSNSNGMSFGLSGSTRMTASYTVPGATVFSNSNNVSFGLNGSTVTATATFAGGGVALSAAGSSQNAGTVVFSNSNGLAFGMNGSTVTGSYTQAAQTAQTMGIYGSSQTTGQSSSSTIDARSLSLVGAGNVSVGLSGGSVVISGAAGGQTNQSLGLYASSQTTGQSSSTTVDARSLSIVGMGLISIGYSGGSLLVSAPGTTNFANLSVSAGTTSGSLGSLVFSNSNGVTFGLNGSTITASAAGGGGGVAIQAGTQTATSGTVIFSNSNGVSFGMSNSSVITASAGAALSTVGLYALGNTTQNSSTTLDQRTLSFNALGAMTMGYSNGSIQVSAPATSSLVGVGGISISSNGATISVSQGALTRTVWPVANITPVSAPGNASMSIQYFPADNPVTATRMDALVAWTAGSSATTNTCAVAMSMYGAIYTRNGASLSSVSSGSTQTTYTYASNSAGNTQLQAGAIRPLSVPVNINMTPGEYYVGFNLVTATSSIGLSTTNCPQTFSMMGGNQVQTALNYAEVGSTTNASVGLYNGMGVYSAASTGLPAALSISGLVATGASLSQANFAFVFRNA
ncbi:MAG: hypothetical protein JWO52_7840 [Gammaproteobacteria bacterium]|nr:hypothetical protein [Gammaproteobacteria bacterium]